MRNVTEIQQRLIDLHYLPPLNAKGETNADGKFGHDSLDAYNHFRATMGKGPLVKVSMDELNADLFPTEIQPLNPKETTMNNANVAVTSSWLSTKNWAAVVGILSVILPLVGIHLPAGWGDTAYQVIAALSGAYILVKNTWFTTTITTASAKKL